MDTIKITVDPIVVNVVSVVPKPSFPKEVWVIYVQFMGMKTSHPLLRFYASEKEAYDDMINLLISLAQKRVSEMAKKPLSIAEFDQKVNLMVEEAKKGYQDFGYFPFGHQDEDEYHIEKVDGKSEIDISYIYDDY